MRWGALVWSLAAVACGGSGSAIGGGDGDARPPADPVPRAEVAMIMVDAVCELNVECLCAPGCDANLVSRVDQIITRAEVLQLDYDPQCMGEWVRRVDEATCDLSDALSESECEDACRPYFGTLTAGESCGAAGGALTSSVRGFPIQVDECDADNVCIGDVCQPRCRRVTGVPEGEPCWFDNCAPGLTCDLDSRTCVDGPGTGDSCSESFLDCGEGWCETTDRICQPLGARGDGCTSFDQCESGYCPNGTCQAQPASGEDCYGPCQEGSRCSSSVCIPYVCWH